tara:strand:+ start:149 stop:769 length:621 start_codon:yes stop_codon:yes gene_type:complete
MTQNNSLLGVILAGGLSRRMNKENKFLKKFNKKTLIEIIVDKAIKQVPNIIINANISKSYFKKIKLEVVKDSIGGFKGPLAGILTGMEYGKKKNYKWLITFPCDAPFFPINLVKKFLLKLKNSRYKIVIVKSNNRIHPVFGIWSISLKDSLVKAMKKDNIRKIDLFIKKHEYAILNFNYNKIDPFFNINNLSDLKKAREYINVLKS